MKITVIGTGYVGLVSGTCLAEVGNDVTEWKEFQSPNFNAIKNTLKSPVVFDGRNLFDPAEMRRLGIVYFGIGR